LSALGGGLTLPPRKSFGTQFFGGWWTPGMIMWRERAGYLKISEEYDGNLMVRYLN